MEKDPYKALGVDPNASLDEIKAAYKKLVAKYHPDKYANNPLRELAEEKLKEINEAYEYIIANYGKNNRSNGYSSYSNNQMDDFQLVRQYIASGNIAQAESILNRITNRTAEWYFLTGIILVRKGNYMKGYEFIRQAVDMDPYNQEYRDTLNMMNQNMNRTYSSNTTEDRNKDCSDCCAVCSILFCIECLCEICCSDL